jgi:hypothetical protein
MARALTEANPAQIGQMYVDLVANCRPGTAARVTGVTFETAIPNEGGRAAAVEAIKIGQADIVVPWVNALQPDDRAKIIRALGVACTDSEPIQDFFLSSAASMGDDFWNDRWYRALGVCQVVPIQDLLASELDKGIGADRSRFFGVLEAYARSAGVIAVPELMTLSKAVGDDQEAQVNIINAFADAAQVGSVDGMNQATAKRATRAIVTLAPSLSQKGIEQARITLNTLGAELESDELATLRYADLKQEDGFVWGVVVVENAPCKGGKRFTQRMHWARAVDPGNTWADQALDKVTSSIEVAWTLDLAERCRAEGENTFHVSSLPFATDDELKAWATDTINDLVQEEAKKVFRVEQEDLNL